jgi:hypothetical protein
MRSKPNTNTQRHKIIVLSAGKERIPVEEIKVKCCNPENYKGNKT